MIGPRAGGDEEVGWVEVSGDGQLLATTSWRGPVNIWDAATGEHLVTVPAFAPEFGFVCCLEWSRDGALLAVVVNNGDEHGEVVIFDRTGAEVATVAEAPGHLIESVSLSPDGHLMATTDFSVERIDPMDMQATVWDWARGEVVTSIGTSAIGQAEFDSTGTRIATSRFVEGTAEVWNAQTGERVATLTAPAEIGDITFSPDGTTVATGHADGTVRLWNAETGAQRLVLRGDFGRVANVVFSPNGSTLASAGDDGIVHVWALDLEDLIAIANERLTRGFSDDECRQYLHLDACPAA